MRSERALKRQLFGCHVDEWPLATRGGCKKSVELSQGVGNGFVYPMLKGPGG